MEDQKPPSLLADPVEHSGAIQVQPGRDAILGALLLGHPWVQRAGKVALVGIFALVTIVGGWYFDTIKDGQERTYTEIHRLLEKLDALQDDIHEVQADALRRDTRIELLEMEYKSLARTIYQMQSLEYLRKTQTYDETKRARSEAAEAP